MAVRKRLKTPVVQFNLQGVNMDLPVNMLPENVFTDVQNMEPWDIGMAATEGNAQAFGTALFAPEHTQFNIQADQFYWLYAGSDGIGVTDGTNHFDITPAAGVTSTWPANWTSTDVNGLSVINNVKDAPVYWDGMTSNIMLPLPGWPAATTAASIRAFKNNLIALDIRDASGDFTNQVMWSNFAAPGSIPDSWTPLPENSAGAVVLADTLGGCLDGLQFRDSFLIFKDHSTYTMNFIGGNSVFAFRKLFASSGVLGTDCAAEYLGNVLLFTDGDIIITDGQRGDSIIDKRMRRWLFNNIDSDNYRTSFVVSYHSRNQVWFCFPENGASECTKALVWDAKDDKYGIRDLKPTPHISRGLTSNVTGVTDWAGDMQAWNLDYTQWNASLFNPTQDNLVQSDRINTKLYAVNEGTTDDGDIITHRAIREGLTFGDETKVKVVRAVWPRITGTPGTIIEIRIGASDFDSDAYAWSDSINYIVGANEKIDVFARGRFIAISLVSNIDQAPYIIHGVEFSVQIKGSY